jgi:superfamily II DNA or RNA helicase
VRKTSTSCARIAGTGPVPAYPTRSILHGFHLPLEIQRTNLMVELNNDLLVELGGWPVLKEARALVERGRVSNVERDGTRIAGRVQGAEKSHDARIVLGDRIASVEVKCTCPESRRSGRVCAHAIAVGLVALGGPRSPSAGLSSENARCHPAPNPGRPSPAPSSTPPKPPSRRILIDEAPLEIPRLEVTFLLPLNLRETLDKDSFRIILEARIAEGPVQPWDALAPQLSGGYAVDEADDRALAALAVAAGGVTGISLIPRAKLGAFLHTLGDHPHVWLGRKERITVAAMEGRPRLAAQTHEDGTLELVLENHDAPSRPGPLPGWSLQGAILKEIPVAPPGFDVEGRRRIAHAAIPAFLERDWPALEQSCDIALPPRFIVATAHPEIAVHLDGSLAGVTAELHARYGDRVFPIGWKAEADANETFADPRDLHRFWRRDFSAEKQAAIEVQAAGFAPVRSGGRAFSLSTERLVARFLANTLPRWRREWAIVPGPRLVSTLEQIDIAEPAFALRRAGSGEDWLSLDLQLNVGGKPVELDAAEIQRWLQTGQSHARTADRRVLLVPTEAWSEMQEVLADCTVEQEPGRMRVARTYAPYLAGALDAQGFRVTRNDAAESTPPDIAARLDPALVAQLRPYQVAGVTWLAALAQRGGHGLLADDMGLGKTLQALAFCAWLRATEQTPAPALVICPTSLVTNWLREAARFTPHLRTLDYTGPDRAARRAEIARADLVVTSYALLRRDIETLRTENFGLVALDEAQHIKNRGSQNAQGAKMLRARHRLILTGTPLENSVLDLWSLFDFLVPGYLGTATDFRERYETPLTRVDGETLRQMARLRQRVRPFFLRRTKEEVLPELPPKLEHLALCELTDEQREVYRAVLAQGRRDVFDNSGKQGAGGGSTRGTQIAMLTTLLRLRQVCCHLDLLPVGDAPRAWREPSAKLDRTFELIDEAIDGGHRVLLFSQFVRMLHLLRDEARRRGIPSCYLDGQTADRQGEIDRFQNDAGVPLFLISLKAGGTGLNLTGADTVIHFDPWWNPAVEDQATSRAHRLGQARAVQAYKLIATGTVEEKIQALQARKRGLFNASVGDEAFVAGLSGEEMEELLAEG